MITSYFSGLHRRDVNAFKRVEVEGIGRGVVMLRLLAVNGRRGHCVGAGWFMNFFEPERCKPLDRDQFWDSVTDVSPFIRCALLSAVLAITPTLTRE